MSSNVCFVLCDNETEKSVAFYCSGCKCHHQVRVRGNDPVWAWNESLEKPTFSPSILTWIPKDGKRTRICHSYVIDGQIRYLPDCFHEYKDKVINLESCET